jgi:hypothetical protein
MLRREPESRTLKIKDIVKNNVARFSFYRAGHAFYEHAFYEHAFYEVEVDGTRYKFPVSLEDLGTATSLAEHKAITLMRYIRKALDDKTFVKA